jgi:single-stranded DNA-binding protein
MQMIDGLVAGRLMGDPERRVGKSDSMYVVAKVRALNNDGDAVIVNVIVFDETAARDLRTMRDGDSVALTGSLTPKVWTDKQGVVRPAMDMVAHRVLACEIPSV